MAPAGVNLYCTIGSGLDPWVGFWDTGVQVESVRRRTFLQTTAAGRLAPLLNMAQGEMPGKGIRLGYDTYSIRAFGWKAIRLLDYAAEQKLDVIQISSLGEYESLDPSHLAKVKSHAEGLGIAIDAGIGSICPTSKSWNKRLGDPVAYIRQGLQVAKAVGASTMRCYLGNSADRLGPLPIEAHIESTVKVLRAVRSHALDLGVTIAVENHSGDLQARELLTLIEEAGKDFVGACLDAGNPLWSVEDPLFTLETLGPCVRTTHIRDTAVWEHPRGAAVQWVALGDGSIDWQHFLSRYRKLCPHAPMQLEIITGRPPTILPYLEPEFWKAFPKANAAEFARFLALVKKGQPFMGRMIIADVPGKQPPEYVAALREQQQIDLERSLDFAKKILGVGIHWQG